MVRNNKSLAELANFMDVYPQKLEGITVKEKIPIEDVPLLRDAISDCEKALDGAGRTVVRYSGTENKIRILVEAEKQKDVDFWTDKLCNIAKNELV
jgi:phosphoglucosamine mutase